MKHLKNVAHMAVIVLTVLALGCIVWFLASYSFSLNAQVSQNTQNIQEIVQFINSKTPAVSALPAQ
jgi:ammonia channel protein AmtB